MKKIFTLSICGLLILCQIGYTAISRPIEQTGWLTITPASIEFPAYTKPSTEATLVLTLKNSGPITITVLYVTIHEDSAKPSAPSGWLGYGALPGDILPGDSSTMLLVLNANGVVTSGPTQLFGKLRFHYGPTGDSLDLPITFAVADSIAFPAWDTLTTACNQKIAFGTNGNLGGNSAGFVNFNFVPFTQGGVECDTGLNGRGNAAIYLADASPVIVRHPSFGQYTASWSIYGTGPGSPNALLPLADGRPPHHVIRNGWPGNYEMFSSGTFCTVDSLVKLERSIFIPYGPSETDSCHFVLMRTLLWPFVDGQSVTNLAIGDIFDFDIPSDTGAPGDNWNVSGIDPTRRLVYVRGFSSQDPAVSSHACYQNSLRYAGASLLLKHFRHFVSDTTVYGAYNAANDSFVYPNGGFVPEQLWANMQSTGYSNETRITDVHSVLVYRNQATTGSTLPANDTLHIWTAVAAVRPTGGTSAQALDSLKKEIDKASRWVSRIEFAGSCCYGSTGNVNKGYFEAPDLSDVSILVTYLTTTPRPGLPCFTEADINSSGAIDLSDLALLISYMTVTPRPILPTCWRGDYNLW